MRVRDKSTYRGASRNASRAERFGKRRADAKARWKYLMEGGNALQAQRRALIAQKLAAAKKAERSKAA